jgi:hypothetical protein
LAKIYKWYISNPKLSRVDCFIFLGIIFLSLASKQYVSNIEFKRLEKNKYAWDNPPKYRTILKNSYIHCAALLLTINDEGTQRILKKWAKKYLNLISAISLCSASSSRHYKYYPLKGNEAAMNLNIFKANHTKIDALKSINTTECIFSGPLVWSKDWKETVL